MARFQRLNEGHSAWVTLVLVMALVCAACGESPATLVDEADMSVGERDLGRDGDGVWDAGPAEQQGDMGVPAVSDGGPVPTDGGTPAEQEMGPPPDGTDTGPGQDTGPTPPRGPVELMVYTANVENLPKTSDGCPGDWKDLFAFMTIQPVKPDLFLVQQVTDQAQLNQITTYMTNNLGRPYAGFIAEADPVPFNSPWGAQKEKQINAVVYASDRLQPASSPSIWRSYKNVNGNCQLDQLSRTRGIALKFLDLASNEFVSAASIHWSTRNGPGADPACAVANARETDQVLRVNHPDATLYLFGGDTNEPDTAEATTSSAYNGWYTETNAALGGALGYLDPIWSRCNDGGDLRQCLLRNWTFNGASNRRIDFLFARRSSAVPAFVDAHTVTFNEGDAADLQLTGTDNGSQNYSDHRSVLMRLTY